MSTRYRLGFLVCGLVRVITALPGVPSLPRLRRSSSAARGRGPRGAVLRLGSCADLSGQRLMDSSKTSRPAETENRRMRPEILRGRNGEATPGRTGGRTPAPERFIVYRI